MGADRAGPGPLPPAGRGGGKPPPCRDASRANCGAVGRLLIRRFLTDHAAADQPGAGAPAGILPGLHPFSVAPAVRAEQTNGLLLQLAFTVLEHGLKFTFFQLLYPHGRAAEGKGVKIMHHGAGKFSGGEQAHVCSGGPGALLNGVGHGFGIAGAAPIYNCNFTHKHFVLSEKSCISQLRSDALRCFLQPRADGKSGYIFCIGQTSFWPGLRCSRPSSSRCTCSSRAPG